MKEKIIAGNYFGDKNYFDPFENTGEMNNAVKARNKLTGITG